MHLSDHITFSDLHVYYAVGFIDMISSTTIVSHLSGREADSLYMTFLNTLATIISENNGKIVKTFGDGIFFYFPKTDFGALPDFENVIAACMKVLDARPVITEKLAALGLPKVSYRISASFGPVSIVENEDASVGDLFGSTVNTCAKMNRLAKPNTLIIGNALYEKLKESKQYTFAPAELFAVNDKLTYMTYTVSKV